MTDLPHYTEYDTRLAAYAVIVDGSEGEDRMLLALWNEGTEKRWTLPGGGVELHEKVEDGAIREVREESGYEVELDGILGVDTFVFRKPRRRGGRRRGGSGKRPLKAVRVVFRAHVVGGELRPEVGGTTEEARWFPLSEIPTLRRVSLADVALGYLA